MRGYPYGTIPYGTVRYWTLRIRAVEVLCRSYRVLGTGRYGHQRQKKTTVLDGKQQYARLHCGIIYAGRAPAFLGEKLESLRWSSPPTIHEELREEEKHHSA